MEGRSYPTDLCIYRVDVCCVYVAMIIALSIFQYDILYLAPSYSDTSTGAFSVIDLFELVDSGYVDSRICSEFDFSNLVRHLNGDRVTFISLLTYVGVLL